MLVKVGDQWINPDFVKYVRQSHHGEVIISMVETTMFSVEGIVENVVADLNRTPTWISL